MKPLPAIIAVAVLAVDLAACGGGSRGEDSVSQRRSGSTAATHAATTSPSLNSPARGVPSTDPQPYVTFGHEAGAAESRAIRAVAERYFAAVAANDGATACSLLYTRLANSIVEDYGTSPPGPPGLQGTTCPEVMSKVFEQRHGRPTPDVGAIEVTTVRIKDAKGIALLHSSNMKLGEITAFHNKGSWQIGQLLGSGLS
jgi:hypothetical protein